MSTALPSLTELAIKHHPLTGEVIRPLWVRPDGRVCWPMLGGAPDDGGGQGGDGGTGTGDGSGGDSGGSGAGGSTAGQRTNATDAQGADLGFPKDTAVAEMTDKEQAAYWRNISRKHEGRVKDLVGDRKVDDVKADLAELAEIRKQQQTPAEQALAEAEARGRQAATAESSAKAATAIFRASLEAQGHEKDDVDDLVGNFNVANFVTDGDVDTNKLTNFAKRFAPAGTGGTKERRDFGAGRRQSGAPERGAGGKAEAARRFGKKTTTDA